MTVYNGKSYIFKQLDSIYNQSTKPDEVIIRDDCSDDETGELIEHFIKERNLSDNWKLYRNTYNKGWKRNFYEAVKNCNGDIIFFADQDDIWHKDKIFLMSSIMEQKDADCVYAGCLFIDSKGNLIKERNKEKFSGDIHKEIFSRRFNSRKTLGCRMCVSRRVLDRFIDLNYPEFSYDTQCGRIALLEDGIWIIDRPLIYHRIHTVNSSGISAKGEQGQSTMKKRLEDIKYSYVWMKRMIPYIDAQGKNEDTQKKKDVIKETLKMQKDRLMYLSGKGKHIWDLTKYRDFYSGWGMLIGDFAYKHGLNHIMGIIADRL